MAGIQDTLNYSKFEFIDSDDEDYVEKSILKTALDPNTNSIATRNAAAHALAKKGKLGNSIPVASSIDKTLSETRTRMEKQLESLTAEMKKLEGQQNKLQNISSPEEAMAFIENSGMTPEEIEKMIADTGAAAGADPKTSEIDKTTNAVTDMASKISKLARGADPELDSDDEVENEPKTVPSSVPVSKKAQSDFEKAFAANKFNNAIAAPPLPPSTPNDSKSQEPLYSSSYTESSFEVSVELPNVKSMASVDLRLSPSEMKLKAKGGDVSYELNHKFKSEVDEDAIKAKFSKKKSRLTISGLLT